MKRAHWSMSPASAQVLEPSGEAAFVEFIRRTRLGVALILGFAIGIVAAVFLTIVSPNSDFTVSDLTIVYAGILAAVVVACLLARIPNSLFRSVLLGMKLYPEITRISVFGVAVVVAIEIIPRLFLKVPISDWVTEKSIFGMQLGFATGFVFILMGPLTEELIFRCWLQTRLTALTGRLSVPITVLIFAAVHGGFAFVMVLPAAIVISVVRFKSKALLPGILVHAMYNMIIYVSLLFIIGHRS